MSTTFQDKIAVWKDTLKRCKLLATSGIIPQKSIKHSHSYNVSIKSQIKKKKFNKTTIEVRNIDCLECGIALKKGGLNPVVLNLADNKFPGGHVQMGSGAQEESIFRRTNYFQTLNHETKFYPLQNTDLVYSPTVHVIKDKYNKPILKNLNNSYPSLSFIACAGLYKPELINGKLKIADIDILKNKIKHILDISHKYGHDVPVLGAIGCGAWRNPPEHVANIFKDVIKSAEYNGVFHTIVFAVLEVPAKEYIVRNRERETCESNYQIFKKILSS